MDYLEGAKLDQLLEKLDNIIQMMEYDLTKKYPELDKKEGGK